LGFAEKENRGVVAPVTIINKKEPPLPAAQGDNREASNRVDRSHSMSRRWTVFVMNEKA
jgi:hypothetical protein